MRSLSVVRWCSVIGVTAAAVFLFSLSAGRVSAELGQGKDVVADSAAKESAVVGAGVATEGRSPLLIGPGIPDDRGLRVLPTNTVDYRNDGPFLGGHSGGMSVIGGPAESPLVGGVASAPGDPCTSDVQCNDCNLCTLDSCSENACSGGPRDGFGCDTADECEGTCTGGVNGTLSCRFDLECCGGVADDVCVGGPRLGLGCRSDVDCDSTPGAGDGDCVTNSVDICTAGGRNDEACSINTDCDAKICDVALTTCVTSGDCPVGQNCIGDGNGICSPNAGYNPASVTDGTCDFFPCAALGSLQCVNALIPEGMVVVEAECNDGLECNGLETCALGACVSGVELCTDPNQVCEESSDSCLEPCITDAQCEVDNDVCTNDVCDFKTCVGGSNDGSNCQFDSNCPDGACSGGGTGLCIVGPAPCGPGGTCTNEDVCGPGPELGNPCSVGSPCTAPSDCVAGFCAAVPDWKKPCANNLACAGSNCDAVGPKCGVGRCCIAGVCSRKSFEECDGLGGTWLHSADACQRVNDDDPNTVDACPVFGSGIAPQGDYGVVVGSVVAAGNCAGLFSSLGDDYLIPPNPNGIAYWDLTFMRFVASVQVSARFAVTFYDSSGQFIEDVFFPDGFNAAAGTAIYTVNFEPPLAIPDNGFWVIRIATSFGPQGEVSLMTTDATDEGTNDPDKMWIDGAATTAHTLGRCDGGDRDGFWCNVVTPDCPGGTCTPIPDVLAYEFVALPRTSDPTGACCNSLVGGCTLKLPWVCEASGDVFQGIGTTCKVCSHDQFQSCDVSGDCMGLACVGGLNDGLACANDGECPPLGVGFCSGTPVCNPVLPACTFKACCNVNSLGLPDPGNCTPFQNRCADGVTPCVTDADCGASTPCLNSLGLTTCPPGAFDQGFGSTCDPDSCVQPTMSGGNTCREAETLNLIDLTVPLAGEITSVTRTGHTGAAGTSIPPFDDWNTGECVGGSDHGTSCDPNVAPDPDIQCTDLPGDVGECSRLCGSGIFNPNGTSQDPGWWEAVRIDDCADLRVDMCTSEVGPGNDPVRPAWGSMYRGCPCQSVIGSAGVPLPIGLGFGAEGSARGEPFCPGDNLWMTFATLPPGTYYYPIYSAPQGTTASPPGAQYQFHVTVAPCKEAACCSPVCIGGTRVGEPCNAEPTICLNGDCVAGTCVDGEMHGFTCDPVTGFVDWCPGGLCDPNDASGLGCNTTNELFCGMAGGTWLDGTDYPDGVCDNFGDPLDGTECTIDDECGTGGTCATQLPWSSCLGTPCETGSCCGPGPGDCVDRDPVTQGLFPKNLCDGGRSWAGAVRCEFQPPPCPVCTVESEGNCLRPNGQYIVTADRNRGIYYSDQKVADDFIALSTAIEQFCYYPSFLNRAFNGDYVGECYDPDDPSQTPPPPDNIHIKFYEDVNGVPAAVPMHELAPVEVTAKASGGEFMRWWTYSSVFDPPLDGFNIGQKYWVEFSGEGYDDCDVFWLTSEDGNGYYLAESDHYDPDNQVWSLEDRSDYTTDVAFCIGGPAFPSIQFPPPVTGACCQCDGVCTSGVPWGECLGQWCLEDVCEPECSPDDQTRVCRINPLYTNATFYPDQTCAEITCANVGEGGGCGGVATLREDCGLPEVIGEDMVPYERRDFQYNTSCSSTDGRPSYGDNPGCDTGAGIQCEQDIWFQYTSVCEGKFNIDLCGDGLHDRVLAVYSNGTAVCPNVDQLGERTKCPPPLGLCTAGANVGLECDGDPDCPGGVCDNSYLIGGGCKDAECGAANGEPSFKVQGDLGICYLVRLGGDPDSQGRFGSGAGTMTISCDTDTCVKGPGPAYDEIESAGGPLVTNIKNRYVSVHPGGTPGRLEAIRVKLMDLPGAFAALNGTELWADVPIEYSENGGRGIDNPCSAASPCNDGSFLTSTLATAPVFLDWSVYGAEVIHIRGQEIVPHGVYQVDTVDISCSLAAPASYSVALTIHTAKWGDAVELSGGEWRAAEVKCGDGSACIRDIDCSGSTCGIVSVFDTLGMLAKFAGAPGAPSKTRMDLLGVDTGPSAFLDLKITVSDTVATLGAFAGDPYPFAPAAQSVTSAAP